MLQDEERVSRKAGENGLAMNAYKVNFAVVMQRDAALSESVVSPSSRSW
jgi:hypothetical protein